MTMEELFVNIF